MPTSKLGSPAISQRAKYELICREHFRTTCWHLSPARPHTVQQATTFRTPRKPFCPCSLAPCVSVLIFVFVFRGSGRRVGKLLGPMLLGARTLYSRPRRSARRASRSALAASRRVFLSSSFRSCFTALVDAWASCLGRCFELEILKYF